MSNEKNWKEILTPSEFEVLRNSGTERPFSGKYNMFSKDGVYYCKGCQTALFDNSAKFDSGCGWPSFSDPISKDSIKYIEDFSHGMHRIEVRCSKCDSHLGHVFDDGPGPKGTRYCINSICLIHQDDL